MQVKNLLGPTSALHPQKALEVASGCNSFWDFSREEKRLHCGFAGDGDVCDRTSLRFAIASFGGLREGVSSLKYKGLKRIHQARRNFN